MGSLDALFADLLAGGECDGGRQLGESGESGETQATARVAAPLTGGEGVANGGESVEAAPPNSPTFATRSPVLNRPESEQIRGLSPNSPDSPTPEGEQHSPIRQGDVRSRPASTKEAPAARRSGNPLMSAAQTDDCHAGGWDDAEIAAFIARRDRLMRWGYAEPQAEALAERLTLRDREGDDRRMCTECAHLGNGGRCLVASAGRLAGADRRLEPVQTSLQRCEAFALRKGLT